MKNCERVTVSVVLLTALSLLVPSLCQATIRHVNPDGLCMGMTPCYTTIQAAIDASASGDIIMLQPGVHSPAAQINVHTSVRILGTQTGVNPLPSKSTSRTPGGPAESIIDGGAGGPQRHHSNNRG